MKGNWTQNCFIYQHQMWKRDTWIAQIKSQQNHNFFLWNYIFPLIYVHSFCASSVFSHMIVAVALYIIVDCFCWSLNRNDDIWVRLLCKSVARKGNRKTSMTINCCGDLRWNRIVFTFLLLVHVLLYTHDTYIHSLILTLLLSTSNSIRLFVCNIRFILW